MMNYLWLIPLLPLLGSAINGILGKRFPKSLISLIACGSVGASFLVAISAVLQLTSLPAAERSFVLPLFTWIASGEFIAKAEFLLDPLSSVMLLVVTGVGFLIHIYSIGYMHAEDGYYRFFSYLNLFMFSMLTLVLSGNFLLMFVGWEGVGLCSYLLIGYYFDRKSAGDAGKKAFIVNRIGDVGFILGIFTVFVTFKSLNFLVVFRKIAEEPATFPMETGLGVLTVIGLLLFVGATGKSAQIPLYVWLPDAMEGPTPVSALIHAATMVTAGVYMVVRCAPIFSRSEIALEVVAVVGALTALLAATIGLVQTDIKRVLA
jgi:NADH-quinone oxidoreductase subunit L